MGAEELYAFGRRGVVIDQLRRIEEAAAVGMVRQRMIRIHHRPPPAEIETMVGDRVEIERTIELDIEAGGMLDRLSAGIPVSVVGCRTSAEGERVQGKGGMDVQITEVGVALLGVRGCGTQSANRQRDNAMGLFSSTFPLSDATLYGCPRLASGSVARGVGFIIPSLRKRR